MQNFVKNQKFCSGKRLWEISFLLTQGTEPSASLQKKRSYDDFSDDEENENNSSISSKSKEKTKEKSKRKKQNNSKLNEAASAFNNILKNDTITEELIAYMQEENECARKNEWEILQMQMQMNLQMFQIL